MTGKRVLPHAHYGDMSRSRSIGSKFSESENVQQEITTTQLQLCYKQLYNIYGHYFKCIFHNIRSLKCHKDELFAEPNILAADIISCLNNRNVSMADLVMMMGKYNVHPEEVDTVSRGPPESRYFEVSLRSRDIVERFIGYTDFSYRDNNNLRLSWARSWMRKNEMSRQERAREVKDVTEAMQETGKAGEEEETEGDDNGEVDVWSEAFF
ncbi:hypothetical protein MAR_016483 [Mya arenaria]|uniref:Uncharacterized protein n=1 Tax=Mya arenaria TaxID=6604 RepID=A0ABY7FMY0_MYAAR|nr:hypothetical protein MAR_016483 [Mya arenaria]